MKLIIQIPCYNEAGTLAVTLSELPTQVEGFANVEWLVIDDGSTDDTVQIARDNGVHHVLSLNHNMGLAHGFSAGIDHCLMLGADVIVNTDADNQYSSADIPNLVAPILQGQADMVIGERPIESIAHFSPIKKRLQKLGSWVVRVASKTSVPDAPSGFRALSRDAAQRLCVFSEYTYTLETLIQAGQKGLAVKSVPVSVNQDLRPSRLVKSMRSYVYRSFKTILRIFVVYRPFRFFMSLGAVLLFLGSLIGLRFLVLYWQGDGDGHVQSLILCAVLLTAGFQTMLVAFLADLIAVNRKLLEEIRYKQKQ